MKVVFLPEVEEYLFKLIETLYYNDYFSDYQNAEKYVAALITYIEQNIHLPIKRKAPTHFKKYGSYYIIYKPNRRTCWYIFFSIHGPGNYLIRYITNNHVSAQHIGEL